MAQTRGGISAKQIERETGVTYKTAWRMCKQIRMMLDENIDPMSGTVEVDESYFGGRSKGTRGRGAENKTAVVGREGGAVEAHTVSDTKRATLFPIISNEVEKGASVFTDEYPVYNTLGLNGYTHKRVVHSDNIYVIGDVHTNTIEGFWSLAKNGIRGVYHHCSAKYLQTYINEYAFRYNHRKDDQPMFLTFLSRSTLAS